MTAPTPMITPSMVSALRVLLRPNAWIASRSTASRVISSSLSPPRCTESRRRSPSALATHGLARDQGVANLHITRDELRERVVRDADAQRYRPQPAAWLDLPDDLRSAGVRRGRGHRHVVLSIDLLQRVSGQIRCEPNCRIRDLDDVR